MADQTKHDPVEIQDVAPRDGFQSVPTHIPAAVKVEVVEALYDAGLKIVEGGSFVSPKAVPQMADTSEVFAKVKRPAGTRLCALVPNLKGVEIALGQGVTDLAYVFSVSESHNQSNVRRSVAQSLDELDAIMERGRDTEGFRMRVNLATSFDCPMEGRVDGDAVLKCLDRVTAKGDKLELGLCDTTGRAFPDQVGNLFRRSMDHLRGAPVTWAYHGHDTFGLGVSNALYAYEAGVRLFDGAAGGLGGCPFAPGATGNTATEDLVFTFENMGIPTGVNLEKLLAVAERCAGLPDVSAGGHLRLVPRGRALADRPAA